MRRPDGNWWCPCHGWQHFASYKAEGDKCALAVSMTSVPDVNVTETWSRRMAAWRSLSILA